MGSLDCTSCQKVCGGTTGEGVLIWEQLARGPVAWLLKPQDPGPTAGELPEGGREAELDQRTPRGRPSVSHPPSPPRADNTCHFEDEKICGYTQDLTDNFDWTRQNALTQNPKRSPNTGPPTDVSGTPEGEDMAYC